jgi:hypothetical protein
MSFFEEIASMEDLWQAPPAPTPCEDLQLGAGQEDMDRCFPWEQPAPVVDEAEFPAPDAVEKGPVEPFEADPYLSDASTLMSLGEAGLAGKGSLGPLSFLGPAIGVHTLYSGMSKTTEEDPLGGAVNILGGLAGILGAVAGPVASAFSLGLGYGDSIAADVYGDRGGHMEPDNPDAQTLPEGLCEPPDANRRPGSLPLGPDCLF